VPKPFNPPPFQSSVDDIATRNDSTPLGKRRYFHHFASAQPNSPRGMDWDTPVSWRAGRAGSRWDRTNSLPELARPPKGWEQWRRLLPRDAVQEASFDNHCPDFAGFNGLLTSSMKAESGFPPVLHTSMLNE
jgi:hypothetical protein